MYKLLPLMTCLILFSCSEDCSDCEKKLKWCYTAESTPVNLPEAPSDVMPYDASVLTVNVTAEDDYIVEDIIYTYEEVEPVIMDWLATVETFPPKMKIAGDKMAHYEAVFRLIAFSKTLEINPILVYTD